MEGVHPCNQLPEAQRTEFIKRKTVSPAVSTSLSVFGINPIKRLECLKQDVALQKDFKLKLQFK